MAVSQEGEETKNTPTINSSEEALPEASEPPSIPRTDELESQKWCRQQTVLLIRLVESNYSKFNDGLKKTVWARIATELSSMTSKTFTAEQCDIKWKSLKRTYKSIKDHNKKTGNDRRKWEFFYALDKFLGKKPEVTPVAVCSTATNKVQLNGEYQC